MSAQFPLIVYWVQGGAPHYPNRDEIEQFCKKHGFIQEYQGSPHNHWLILDPKNDKVSKETICNFLEDEYGIVSPKTTKRDRGVSASNFVKMHIRDEVRNSLGDPAVQVQLEVDDLDLTEIITEANSKYGSNLSSEMFYEYIEQMINSKWLNR